MLRQRVITALIMAGLFLSAIVFLPLPGLAIVFGLLIGGGGWEWSRLAGWQSHFTRGLYVLVLLAILAAIYVYCQLGGDPPREKVQPIVGLACLWWSFALLWIRGYPGSAMLWRSVPMRSLMGLLILAPAWTGAVFLLSFHRGGLLLVVIGARILVPAASEIAYRFGVPEDVIAATMVAFGTSLPELMTAIAAVRKGHPEITVGNIVGADVLNVLFVIGAAAAAAPLAIPPNFYYFHFPAMLIILFSFRVFISMNRTVFHRWQGVWLLGVYGTYVFLQYALNIGAAH